MDHPLHDMIEAALAKANKEGVFDNLPGQGKPLTHLDGPNGGVNVTLKSAAGIRPKVAELSEAITKARQDLATLKDPEARKTQMKHLSDLQTRHAIEVETAKRNG